MYLEVQHTASCLQAHLNQNISFFPEMHSTLINTVGDLEAPRVANTSITGSHMVWGSISTAQQEVSDPKDFPELTS